jgi:hypothetical protein
VPAALRLGRVQTNEPHFAGLGSSFAEARELIRSIEEAKRVIELQRSARPRGSSLDLAELVVSALGASPIELVHDRALED